MQGLLVDITDDLIENDSNFSLCHILTNYDTSYALLKYYY